MYRCQRLLTPDGWSPDATLEVTDGTITAVTMGGSGIMLDGTVVPGFVDLQVNGFGDHNVTAGSAEQVGAIAESLLSEGVTSWLPTIVSSSEEVRLASLDAVAGAPERGARILGVHLEGPWINPRRAGAHDVTVLGPPDDIDVTVERHPGLVRLVSLAPELPGALEAVGRLTQAGVMVSVGHSDATYAQAKAAFDAGATMLTHVFNASRPLHHREPGVIGAALTDRRVTVGVIADLVHLHPATVELVFRAAHGVVLVSDAVGGVTDAPRRDDGTLAGAAAGLGQGVRNAIDLGIDPEVALDAAAGAPARLLRADFGQLRSGAPADFVVLDDDWAPVATYLGGNEVWTR